MKAKKIAQISHQRRRILGTLGLPVASFGLCRWTHAKPQDRSPTPKALPACTALAESIPCFGVHQAGIVTPRPVVGMVAAFIVLAEHRQDLERLFKILTQRISFLTRGGQQTDPHPQYPPSGSGLLGPSIQPDALTITVSVGASLFDERFKLSHLKPRHLQRMPNYPNDALNASLCHGDLSIQFCAYSPDTVLHALRDVIKHTPDLLLLHWKQEGSVAASPPCHGGPEESARNYLGFRDGSANPDASDTQVMDEVVWVAPHRGEPAWATHGTYQVVRIIRNYVERWDRTPLQEQETIFGRRKNSGAPLDGGQTEQDVPNYAQDPHGVQTPMTSHIRLANPRTSASQANLILRRPFNYSNGISASGQLDMGLLFICYQADLARGFMTVQDRLNGEPLEEYIKPIGGGFFFTLPGIIDADDWLGRSLLQA